MAVTHIQSATHNEAAPTTSCTLTIPATAAVDDIAVIAVDNRNATTQLTVTDDDTGGNAWALISNLTIDTSRSGQLFWKRATSGTASKTVTISGASNSIAAGLSIFRGADTSATPYEAVAGESNASADETIAAISVSADSMVLLAIFNVLNDLTPSAQACTDPGALTEFFNALSTGGSDCGVNLSGAVKTTAGSTGAFTWAQTDNITGAIAFGLKIAAAGGGSPPARRPNNQQRMMLNAA